MRIEVQDHSVNPNLFHNNSDEYHVNVEALKFATRLLQD